MKIAFAELLFGIFLTWIGTPPAWAQGGATYYVATTGSDSNTGTSASPWRTIQKAANMLNGGDTVIVNPGTYAERVQVITSGTTGRLLTFQTQGTVVTRGFNIQASYVKVTGFEITNTPGTSPSDRIGGSGFYLSGSNLEVSNNYIHHSIAAGIYLESSTSNGTISGNRVAYGVECAIYIQGTNNLIASNDLSHTRSVGGTAADGVFFFGSGNIVRQNYIHDIVVSDSPGQSPYINAFSTWGPATNFTFEQNRIDKQPSQPQGFSIEGWEQPVGNITIRNNVFITRGTDYYNPDINAGEGGPVTNLTIANNTMVALSGPVEYTVWLARNLSGAVVKNNAIYDHGSSTIPYIQVDSGASGVVIGFNSISKSDMQPPQGSPYPNDLWMVNPQFMNLAAGDFHLQATSPLINRGTTLSAVTNDYDGVVRPQGSGYDIGAFEYLSSLTPPSITSFTPSSGPVGTNVTISGSNFSGATAITFNGVSASFTVNSATSIQATVPVSATTGPVSVTTAGGTANSSSVFTVSPPTITSFTPTSGPVGTGVTISGTNFIGTAGVTFNGVSAAFTVNSATTIQATVPAGATTGPIRVTASGGTATSGSAFTVSAPTITTFTPTSGAQGASVAISGTNFTGTSGVAFNGTSASFTVSSATSIQATVPAGASTGSISVTTSGGTATSGGVFTVTGGAPTTTYYVATTGNDSNAGTSASPWKTIQKAANTLNAGDSVVVNAGTYNERVQINRSGSAGQLLTFQTQGTVVMKGFNIQASYINVAGFEITNTPGSSPTDRIAGSGFYVSGSNVEIANNYVHHSTAAGIYLSSSTSNSNINGNRVAYGVECGIYIQGSNNLVVSNDISHTRSVSSTGADGMRFFGSGNTVRRNYIHDIMASDSPSQSFFINAFFTWGPATGYVFEQNLVDKHSSQPQGLDIEAYTQPVGNITVRNNVFITRGTGYNPAINAGDGGVVTNVVIVNNTFVAMNGPVESAVWLFSNVNGAIVRNNATYDHGNNNTVPYIQVDAGASGLDIGSNSVSKSDSQPPKSPAYPGDLWMVNPLFTNLAAGDFHLQPASPLINHGTTQSQVASDYDGVGRPQGPAYDIGAFEAVSVTPPAIASFNPTSGPVGTSVTISGVNFTGTSAVKFNGTSSSFTVNSATSIQATVPAGATSGPISVTAPGGTVSSGSSFTVTASPPTITSFTPTNGSVGTSVTISGTNFTGTTAVKFNGTSSSFTVNSGTSIQATVPAGATSGPISVTAPGGTVSSGSSFTVTASPPVISSFTPTSGPVGTSVTISGTNFTGTTAVKLNGTIASFTVNSSTSIQATVPAGATSGPISVTTPGGTVASGSSFTVTASPPTITSFTPTSGPVGTSVTISGTNFTGTTAVKFNGTSASFTVNSSTSIQATVPAGATSGPISVTASGGSVVSADPFTVSESGDTPRRFEETDPSVAFTAGWSSSTVRPWSGVTAAVSSTSGAQARFTFTGTAVSWIGFRGPQSGIARVYMDGAFVAEIDTYASAEEVQSVMFSRTGLAATSHTLMIEVTGLSNPNATDAFVVVDAFDAVVFVDTTPPAITITSPGSGSTVAGTISVNATASDNVGVAGVFFEIDGVDWSAEDTTAPYSLSWDTSTASNGAHTLNAVAIDAAGNYTRSVPVTVTAFNVRQATHYEETDPRVTFTSGWATVDSTVKPWSGDTAAVSTTPGAQASFTFSGVSVNWIGLRGPLAGIARLFLDGTFVAEVDGYTPGEQVQAVVYSMTGVSAGTHTLTIEVTGRKNPAATDPYIVVDAFDVAPEQLESAISLENQEPGSADWEMFLNGYQPADDVNKQIKGYASATSVNKGQAITFHVSVNPAQTFTMDVYRMGWYQGLGGRLMQHIGPLNGVRQSDCPVNPGTGLIECSWSASYTLNVPTTWTSGVFLVQLTNTQGYQNYITFVVRDDARHADLLYQQSVTTYQAYNNYPSDGLTGKSLYEYNSFGANTMAGTPRAVKVSWNRPYARNGSGDFLSWEYYFIRWLERSGYDVTYSTDLDTHQNSTRLLNSKAFLSVGHDEYWSKAMVDGVEHARDAGVHLGFFGANAVYWQVRFEASPVNGVADRVMVCYKSSDIDPVQGPTTTVTWRDSFINRPEQRLIGVQSSVLLPDNNAPYVVSNSSNWVYTSTTLADGDSIPGLVGYEADSLTPSVPTPDAVPGTYVALSQSPAVDRESGLTIVTNASVYQAPGGAWVFAAGTISWSWGLDRTDVVDWRVQQITKNVLNRFLGIFSPPN